MLEVDCQKKSDVVMNVIVYSIKCLNTEDDFCCFMVVTKISSTKKKHTY